MHFLFNYQLFVDIGSANKLEIVNKFDITNKLEIANKFDITNKLEITNKV